MEPIQQGGLSYFLSQTDAVGVAIVVILITMSLVTWTLIVAKGIQTMGKKTQQTIS